MRVIILTHGGADLVIDRVASLEGVEIAGIFIERVTSPYRGPVKRLKRSIRYDGVLATLGKFLTRRGDQDSSGPADDRTIETADRHRIPVTFVDNYHSTDSIELLRAEKADLAILYGTNIIKESVFTIPRLGSINLHQGMAPYYRGGPPVFWELFNDESEVGITVHFVERKVDTGDIVLQRSVPLVYEGSFGVDFESFIAGFRSKLRITSADLIRDAVASIAGGSYVRKSQDVSLGKRYRLPTKKEKDLLRAKLKERLKKGQL